MRISEANLTQNGRLLPVWRQASTMLVLFCRYQEKFYFNPGDTGFKVFKTKFANIGVLICWDQWFPEPARCLALQGAEVRTGLGFWVTLHG